MTLHRRESLPKPHMLTFLCSTTQGQPVWLCEDVRRHIHALSLVRRCTRCDKTLSSTKRADGRERLELCFAPGVPGATCLVCWHRTRWPRP